MRGTYGFESSIIPHVLTLLVAAFHSKWLEIVAPFSSSPWKANLKAFIYELINQNTSSTGNILELNSRPNWGCHVIDSDLFGIILSSFHLLIWPLSNQTLLHFIDSIHNVNISFWFWSLININIYITNAILFFL